MSKVFYDFDPEEDFGIKVPKSAREDVKSAVADFVKESVLSYVGEGESPVAGGKWKRELSKAYKKRKGEVSSAKFANLELNGDLMDSLEVQVKRGGKLRLTVSESQQDKADGHNNFSGRSQLPAREFIPNAKKGQTFKKDIRDGIKRILVEYQEDGDGE